MMKILKTYKELFENINKIQNINKGDIDFNNLNLGEKLLYNFLYKDDSKILDKLINIDMKYEIDFLKYGYDYDRISIKFGNDDINDFFDFNEYEITNYVDYNSHNIPEEYIDTEQLSNYFDNDKLKKLLNIDKDIDNYDILYTLEKTDIDKYLNEIKTNISLTYENAKQKTANDIQLKIPFDISASYTKKRTSIDITINLEELDKKETLKDYLLKYQEILADAYNITNNFYDEIENEYLDNIPDIVKNVYSNLENNIDDVLKSLDIRKYNIIDIIKMGGVLLKYIKTEKYQDSILFNGDDLYNMTETYNKLKEIIHPNIERKFKKLTTKKKFNI